MERHLTGRTYLVGERCTIADLALYSYSHMTGAYRDHRVDRSANRA